MRRLYLHVGLHKTGTSYLQRLFVENRALLAAAGLGLGPFQDPVSGSHHPILAAIEREGPEAVFARAAEAPGERLLISAEELSEGLNARPGYLAAIHAAAARHFEPHLVDLPAPPGLPEGERLRRGGQGLARRPDPGRRPLRLRPRRADRPARGGLRACPRACHALPRPRPERPRRRPAGRDRHGGRPRPADAGAAAERLDAPAQDAVPRADAEAARGPRRRGGAGGAALRRPGARRLGGGRRRRRALPDVAAPAPRAGRRPPRRQPRAGRGPRPRRPRALPGAARPGRALGAAGADHRRRGRRGLARRPRLLPPQPPQPARRRPAGGAGLAPARADGPPRRAGVPRREPHRHPGRAAGVG